MGTDMTSGTGTETGTDMTTGSGMSATGLTTGTDTDSMMPTGTATDGTDADEPLSTGTDTSMMTGTMSDMTSEPTASGTDTQSAAGIQAASTPRPSPLSRRGLGRRQQNVIDNTSNFPGGNKKPSYQLPSVDNAAYNDTGGYNYALLVNHLVDSYVVSCADGNVYMFNIDGDDNPFCSEMWSSQQDVLVHDGARRFAHYYTNTMDTLGVSRVRVDDDSHIVEGGQLIAWVPYETEPDNDGDDYLYLGVDPNDNIFFPVVCLYDTGLTRLFLTKDPEEGSKTLTDPALANTVTGGNVQKCSPLRLLQGFYVYDEEDGLDDKIEDDETFGQASVPSAAAPRGNRYSTDKSNVNSFYKAKHRTGNRSSNSSNNNSNGNSNNGNMNGGMNRNSTTTALAR